MAGLVAACSSPSAPTFPDAPAGPSSAPNVSSASYQPSAPRGEAAGYGSASSSSAGGTRDVAYGNVRSSGAAAAGEEFNCTNVQEVFVRFGHPGWAVDNAVGLFVSYTGVPAGQKLLRVWWDYEGTPGAYQDFHFGDGEVQRGDDGLFDLSSIVEHAYEGLTAPTLFRVRAELMILGKTGNCARVRDVTAEPGDRVVAPPVYQLVNGSFETGDLSGWTVQDLTSPYRAFAAVGAGIKAADFGSFLTAPTDGSFAALTGFDGNGPGDILLSQIVTVTAGATTLRFDYRGGWDLTYGATIDRTFSVEILDTSGSVLASTTLLTAVAGATVNDTGIQAGAINLSAYQGTAIRIQFRWNVPQNYTGPAHFQLDNVRLGP
jgi:hypothetical protein